MPETSCVIFVFIVCQKLFPYIKAMQNWIGEESKPKVEGTESTW